MFKNKGMLNTEMFDNEVENFYVFKENLLKIKTKNNPFLEKGFNIRKMESGITGPTHRSVLGVRIFYDDDSKETKIYYQSDENFIASYIALLIVANPFDFDPWTKVLIGDESIGVGPTFEKFFKNILEYSTNHHVITIKYSQTELGNNSFIYNKDCIIFIIDKYHDDFDNYFKELEIWKKNNESEE